MRRGVVFGAGGTGRHVYEMSKDSVDILFFVDSDETKWGGKCVDNKDIKSPEELRKIDIDVVLLGTLMGLDEVPEQLRDMGIPVEKLDRTYVQISVKSRILFLSKFAERAYKEGIQGAVAEAGVYRGEFAKQINKFFSDRKCYLFDTFEGFTESDIEKEQEGSLTFANHLKNVNVEETLAKMPFREQIDVKIGRFPETAEGIKDKFAFVNLDMDLYEPTIGGLRIFYPLMADGGVIIVHVYFIKVYPGIVNAIDDYERELGFRLHKMPIGDDISMAIIK